MSGDSERRIASGSARCAATAGGGEGPRRVGLGPLLAWALLAGGCTPDGGQEAVSEYRGVLEDLREGSLARAYDRFMPPSYDRDLNDLLDRARELVTDEELAALRDLGGEMGAALSAAFQKRADRYPVLGVVAEGLKDLPGLLGLEDASSFRDRDVRGFLQRLDEKLFARLSGTEYVRNRIERAEVTLLDAKGDWARLRFASRDDEGRETVERRDVIRIDGKWVPNEWVVEWPRQVARWKESLETFAALKRENPRVIAENLRALRAVAADLDAVAGPLLERLGLAPGEPERGEPRS